MQLFFNPEITEEDQSVIFSKEESRHMVKVLRMSSGDQLHITNGKGDLFVSEISIADAKRCVSTIKEIRKQERHPYRLHMAVAPTKMNDRYEWFLEKATEIGVDTITPIICDNSERKVIKPERYEKILISAMKQSLNCYLPELQTAMSFNEFIKNSPSGQLYIAHCEDSEKRSLKNVLVPKSEVTILIGPEGDFSSGEIELALANKYSAVSLGNSRLRTETAAIVACHTVALSNE